MRMNLTDLKTYFGLSKPYNFSVAVPFLLSLILLLGVFCLFLTFYETNNVSFGTQRFEYFIYLSALLLSAALLARRPKISFFLIAVAFIELSLGSVTSLLAYHSYGFTALPRNADIDRRFIFHPFLQGVPKPTLVINGKRGEVRHNSLGVRGKEIPDTNAKKIFVYGGSSTYDVGVGEGETWTEQLNEQLGNKATVVNFGMPGYSTAEHVMQTAFYGDIKGAFPSCAVYYIGWNDIHNAHVPTLDRGYADFHFPGQIGTLEVRKVLRVGGFSPLFIVALRTISGVIETVTYPNDFKGHEPIPGSDERLEKIYRNNIQTISAINRGRQVPTVFIAQILNRDKLVTDNIGGWIPFVREKDIWALQARFNKILGEKAAELHDGFIDVGVDNFHQEDFVDDGHFNPGGAKKFATLVSKDLRKLCRFEK